MSISVSEFFIHNSYSMFCQFQHGYVLFEISMYIKFYIDIDNT